MENGFTAQLMNSVTPMPRQWFFTCARAAKSTRSSIGMTITQISTPTGMLTLATSRRPTAWNAAGNSCPSAMPTTMQRNTHTVR
ncbi:hypothetical protein D9M72_576230 [compost metagenome]